MEMEDVIIRALLEHGYTTDDILLYDNTEYISTFNPLTDDKNSKSCIIFKDSGILKMLNGTFERNGKVFTTMTPTQWLRSIQKMKYYIAYICYKNPFSKKDLTEYTEYLEDYMLSLAKKNKRFEEMRKIFYSFHFKNDCWRTGQVRNIGVIDGNKPAYDNDWEEIKKKGDNAIQSWIDNQLNGRSCTIVLIGEETSERKWVKYEIKKSWNEKKGILGIYIHNLKDSNGGQSNIGKNPFEEFLMERDNTKLSSIAKVYNPPFTDSKKVYEYIYEDQYFVDSEKFFARLYELSKLKLKSPLDTINLMKIDYDSILKYNQYRN